MIIASKKKLALESGLWFVTALSLVALCEVLLYYLIFTYFSKSLGSGSTQLLGEPRRKLAPHLKSLTLLTQPEFFLLQGRYNLV